MTQSERASEKGKEYEAPAIVEKSQLEVQLFSGESNPGGGQPGGQPPPVSPFGP